MVRQKDKFPDFSKMTEGEALYSLGARATVRNGKKGILLPNPDKWGEPLFIEASDERPGAIVASHLKKDRVKGARKAKCSRCRRHVWLSPSSWEMLRHYPGVPVMCVICFIKQMEKEKKENKEAK